MQTRFRFWLRSCSSSANWWRSVMTQPSGRRARRKKRSPPPMMNKFFSRGRGGGRGPTEYVTADSVRETDDQGRYLKSADGRPVWVERNPRPEVLRGNPATTRALIDGLDFKNKYSSGVIAFASEDAPTEAQQQAVMDDFERLAF